MILFLLNASTEFDDFLRKADQNPKASEKFRQAVTDGSAFRIRTTYTPISTQQSPQELELERRRRQEAEQKSTLLTKELARLQNIATTAAMAERFHAEDAQMWSVKMQNLQRRIAEGSTTMESQTIKVG